MSTIKTIKERMTALKNKCISRMSKVGEIQPSDQEAVEKVKNCATPSSYYNFLGKTEQKLKKKPPSAKLKTGMMIILLPTGQPVSGVKFFSVIPE